MAKRRSSRSGQARREQPKGHGVLSFFAGLISGLALATYAWYSGLLTPPQTDPAQLNEGTQEPPSAEVAPARDSREYDFYTVLPEMEVLVPEQEITAKASTGNGAASARSGPYFLQVGSFRQSSDAESQKAKLALLGLVANIQVVTVDGNTWHRVRVGPVESARETDGLRRRLEENDFEAIVLRGQ